MGQGCNRRHSDQTRALVRQPYRCGGHHARRVRKEPTSPQHRPHRFVSVSCRRLPTGADWHLGELQSDLKRCDVTVAHCNGGEHKLLATIAADTVPGVWCVSQTFAGVGLRRTSRLWQYDVYCTGGRCRPIRLPSLSMIKANEPCGSIAVSGISTLPPARSTRSRVATIRSATLR